MIDRSGEGENYEWLRQTYEGMEKIESSILIGAFSDSQKVESVLDGGNQDPILAFPWEGKGS